MSSFTINSSTSTNNNLRKQTLIKAIENGIKILHTYCAISNSILLCLQQLAGLIKAEGSFLIIYWLSLEKHFWLNYQAPEKILGSRCKEMLRYG